MQITSHFTSPKNWHGYNCSCCANNKMSFGFRNQVWKAVEDTARGVVTGKIPKGDGQRMLTGIIDSTNNYQRRYTQRIRRQADHIYESTRRDAAKDIL